MAVNSPISSYESTYSLNELQFSKKLFQEKGNFKIKFERVGECQRKISDLASRVTVAYKSCQKAMDDSKKNNNNRNIDYDQVLYECMQNYSDLKKQLENAKEQLENAEVQLENAEKELQQAKVASHSPNFQKFYGNQENEVFFCEIGPEDSV